MIHQHQVPLMHDFLKNLLKECSFELGHDRLNFNWKKKHFHSARKYISVKCNLNFVQVFKCYLTKIELVLIFSTIIVCISYKFEHFIKSSMVVKTTLYT